MSAREGGCTCGAVRYRLLDEPIVVHCCHCRWCQRESGAAFALNAVIESTGLVVASGAPELVRTPSASGKGQEVARCPQCRVALWSHYAGTGRKSSFVRVGTLDEPDRCPPDVHIFVASKQPWVVLSEGDAQFDQFYSRRDVERIYGVEGALRWQKLRDAQP